MRARSLACLGFFFTAGAFVVVDTSCSSSNNTTTTTTPDAGGTTWVIGVSNSLTGGLQGIGQPLHNAWTVAQTYVNANGGILGKNLEFVEIDDASDENTASDDGGFISGVAQQLLNRGVAAVIGPNGSSQVGTVDQLFYNAKVIELTATATSTTLSTAQPAGDRYLFRTVPADDLQGAAVARLAELGPSGISPSDAGAANTEDAGDGGGSGSGGLPGCQKMALFYYTNAYGAPMATVIKSKFAPSGGATSIVADVQTDTAVHTDYSTEIKTITDAHPDCLAMVLYDDVGDAFLRQLTQTVNPLPFWIMGTDGVYTQSFIDNGRTNPADKTSPTVVEGVYGTNPDTNPTDNPDYQFFKNLYTASYPLPAGQDVPAYASNEFDAAILIALAIQKAGGVSDHVKLRDSLLAISNGKGRVHGAGQLTQAIEDIQNNFEIDYSGASGFSTLDPNSGGVTAGYIIWHVENGQFVTLKHLKPTEL
ncbi:MAG TPA: ABC transporter substrate-binding protein [Polyangiaceae bacterium]|jgi:branched-chain amino acid transport system substrate-binding protein